LTTKTPKWCFLVILGQLCTKPKMAIWGFVKTLEKGPKNGSTVHQTPKSVILAILGGLPNPENGHFGGFGPTVYQKPPKMGAFQTVLEPIWVGPSIWELLRPFWEVLVHSWPKNPQNDHFRGLGDHPKWPKWRFWGFGTQLTHFWALFQWFGQNPPNSHFGFGAQLAQNGQKHHFFAFRSKKAKTSPKMAIFDHFCGNCVQNPQNGGFWGVPRSM